VLSEASLSVSRIRGVLTRFASLDIHSLKIYHRDLKDNNLVWLDGMCSKLSVIDFGCGVIGNRGAKARVSNKSFMPPEGIIRMSLFLGEYS
jgi:serine/threonine protein kinase